MSEVVTQIVSGSPAATAEAPATPAKVETPAQTPATPAEAQTPASPQAEPKEDDFNTRFQAMARKEKYLRDQEAKNKAEAEKYKTFQELEAQAASNPLAVMEKYGVTLDQLIAASLGEDAPAKTVEEQLQALKDDLAAEKETAKQEAERKAKEELEAYQQSIDEAILKHQMAITEHLGQNAERYELIKLQKAESLVWEVTEAHYDANDGEILTPEQAADKVEAYLEGQVKKAMELARFKKQTEQTQEFSGYQVEEKNPAERKASPTLTSDLAAPVADKSSNRHLSHEESQRKAAQLLKWT